MYDRGVRSHDRKRRMIGEFGLVTERDVCLPDGPVQRAIRTERPIAEKCRVSHLENKKMLTILREVMPLRAMLKDYSFPRLSS